MSKTTFDLSTLNLAAGTYSITVKAEAEGYTTSDASNAINYTFTIPIPTDSILFAGETSDFTLKATNKTWDGTVEYSTDKNTWSTWDGSEISSANKKLYLRGKNNTTFYTTNGAKLVLSEKAGCYGNINTLLDYENPPTAVAGGHCYRSMFLDCTSLTSAPALPATTLAGYCYQKMFQGCTSLTTAPVLSAIILATSCYQYMFSNCTSLTAAPELPATTLKSRCYSYMFSGCTSLKISSTQTEEYTIAWRIPSKGRIASTATEWSVGMLENTGGTFTSKPSINTTYYIAG